MKYILAAAAVLCASPASGQSLWQGAPLGTDPESVLKQVPSATSLEELRPLGRQLNSSIDATGPTLAGKPSKIGFVFNRNRLSHVAVTPRFEPNQESISAAIAALATFGKSPEACPIAEPKANLLRASCSWAVGPLNYEISGSGPETDFTLTLWITSQNVLPSVRQVQVNTSTGPARPNQAASGWTRRVENDPYSGVRAVTWRALLTPVTRDGISGGAPFLVLSCAGTEAAASLHFPRFSPPPLINDVYTFGVRLGDVEPTEFSFDYISYGWLDMIWDDDDYWAADLFLDLATRSHPIIASLTNGYSGAATRYRATALPAVALKDLTPCIPSDTEE